MPFIYGVDYYVFIVIVLFESFVFEQLTYALCLVQVLYWGYEYIYNMCLQ